MQDTAVGENTVKLRNTRATAVKEKEGKLLCQPEVLCEGNTGTHSTDLSRGTTFRINLCVCFLTGFELPRMNYDANGKRHRFVYGNCVEHSVVSKQVRPSAHRC